MDIQEGLKKATIEAAKARDQLRLDTLRMTTSALKYKSIEKGKALEPAEVMAVLLTLCKQRRDSIEKFEQGGRKDLADQEKKELEILMAFLPKQLSKEDVTKKAKEIIDSVGAKSMKEMGKVMKLLTSALAGKAEGSVMSQVVRDLLK